MRFMVLVKGDDDTEAGVMPSEQLLADMQKYNGRSAPMRSRRRSPPATRERAHRRTPTGSASPLSTTHSPNSRRHR